MTSRVPTIAARRSPYADAGLAQRSHRRRARRSDDTRLSVELDGPAFELDPAGQILTWNEGARCGPDQESHDG
jgi:hypothetical protein